MKTTKNLTLIIFLFLTINIFAQTKKEIVYIRIQENINITTISSYASVIYPDKPTKYIELKRLERDGYEAEGNGKIIQQLITELLNDNYELLSSSVGADLSASTTIMIFVRPIKTD